MVASKKQALQQKAKKTLHSESNKSIWATDSVASSVSSSGSSSSEELSSDIRDNMDIELSTTENSESSCSATLTSFAEEQSSSTVLPQSNTPSVNNDIGQSTLSKTERKDRLKQSINALSDQVLQITETIVLTDHNDPSYANLVDTEAALKKKLLLIQEAYKALFENELTENVNLPPLANQLMWQWNTKVFYKHKHVFRTPAECVSDFENTMQAHHRPMQTWKANILPVLTPAILPWYNSFVKMNPKATWDEFKRQFLDDHGENPLIEKENALNRLLNMRYHNKEDIHAYIERFHDLRIKSETTDLSVLKHCLVRNLPAELFKDVHKDIFNNDGNLTAENITEPLLFHHAVYRQTMDRQRSVEKRKEKKSSRSGCHGKDRRNKQRVTKKLHCIIHTNSNDHSTKDCRTRIKCAKEGKCYHCFQKRTANHQCSKSSSKKNNGNNNKKSKFVVPMDVDKESSSSSSSDGEDTNMTFAAARLDKIKKDCKSDKDIVINLQYFQIPPEGLTTDNLIYLPITIENVKCWALLDSGSNFSTISPTLCKFINSSVSLTNKKQCITLINNDKTERIGKTKQELRIQYGSEVTYSTMELFTLFADKVHASIGNDLLFKLGLYIQNIQVTWDGMSDKPMIPAIEPYPYTPNQDPYFSQEEQDYLLLKIQPYITKNENIPRAAYCTIPGSEIKLPLKKDAQNAYRRQYPINECHVQAVRDQVQKWIDLGIVERAPPNIPYNSPILTVPKKNARTGEYTGGDVRCVIDSRLINNNLDKTRIDKFPLPLISDLHRIMSQYTLYTTIDLSQCFHSFRIRKCDRPLTAFTTPDGIQLQFKRAPFGLTPISSVVQRSLTNLFADLDYVVNFIDDIYVLSNNDLKTHKNRVKTVIKRLTYHNLRINPDKLHVAQQSIYVLGFCLSGQGLTLDQRKVANVLDWPDDVKNSKELSHRLGVINYFRDHIPNIARLTAPLNQLKNHPNLKSVWTAEHSQTMNKLKEALVNAPILSVPNLKYPFYLVTDACDYGIGGCLYQVIHNEVKYIGFVARTLTPTERRYGSSRRELLAVVYSFTKWRSWLYGKHFHLFVDNKALLEINKKEVKRLNRIIESYYETIFEMDFDITYCAGMRNVLADALSRLFYPDVENALARDEYYTGKESIEKVEKEKDLNENSVSKINTDDVTKIQSDTENDITIENDDTLVLAASHLDKYNYIEDLDERKQLIEKVHALGHYGSNQTELKIKKDHNAYWKGLRDDVSQYVKECSKCARHNLAKRVYHEPKSICPNCIWDHIAIDLGSFNVTSSSGNNFILVIVDLFSRFVVLRPIRTKTAVDVAKELTSVFSLFGYPKCLTHDNGLEFKNKILKSLKDHMGIEESLSLPYTPTGNAVAEASVGSAKRMIIKMLEGYNQAWDMYVDGTTYAMNQHISRLHGLKPFEVMFNRTANDLKDWTKDMSEVVFDEKSIDIEKLKKDIEKFNNNTLPEIRKTILDTQRKDNEYFMKKKTILKDPFPIGSTVMIENMEDNNSKPDANYLGPFKISGYTQNGSYILTDTLGNQFDRPIATQQIKLVATNETYKKDDNKGIYEVQSIIDHEEIAPNKYKYLTTWVGYPEEKTWQEPKDFTNLSTIKNYWKNVKANTASTTGGKRKSTSTKNTRSAKKPKKVTKKTKSS